MFIKKKRRYHEKYQYLSKEEKNQKQQCGHEWYKNSPEDGSWVLVEYRENYYEVWKSETTLQIKTDWYFWLALSLVLKSL